jgi:hypothetical protein
MKMRTRNSACILTAVILAYPMALASAPSIPVPQPQMQSISPTSASYGTQITITGTGFDPENNDIGFTKVRKEGMDSQYVNGYINNVPSRDGKTLVFELPQSVGVCAFSTMEPGDVCIEIALMLDEGEYEVFVVNKNGASNRLPFKIMSGVSLMQKIQTRAGELTLSYSNGMATLSGTLQRSTPCVDWQLNITSTKDLPPSNVHFQIFDRNKGVICIQVLGEPQEITATTMAGEHTVYRVTLDEDLVFSGTLVQTIEPVEENIELHMKVKNNLIVLSLRNNDEVPVYGLEIKATGTVIMSTRTRAWDSEKIDESTVRLNASVKPVMKDRNLIVLVKMEDVYSGIAWKAFDEHNSELRDGAMIPR